MKVAVTAEGPELDSRVDPRFGRCAHFLFVELEGLGFEAVENPNTALGGGAGIQSAQLVSGRGAQVVLTGNVGPNAYRTLEAAGLRVVTGASGTVRQAVEAFKSGALSAAQGATVESHFGMGAAGQGPGAALGPRTGGGTGGGMGRGGGMGGGGGSSGRPVAIIIIIGPEGVTVKQVVDVTRIALAGVTAWGTMFMLLRGMRKAGKR